MTENASILIVDDDPVILKYIVKILEFERYQVLTARDGVEALDVLQFQPIDLIVTDIMMPRLNGYQLHECVIQNPKWVSIPVIFLSARCMDSDIRYGKEMGVDDYLTKPIEPEDLLAAVRGRLRRAQQLQTSSDQVVSPSSRHNGASALGGLRIDSDQYRVWLDDEPIKLSLKEFKLLERLAHQPDRVVPLEELVQTTHGLRTDYTEASALLRPLVRSVRRKLGYPAGEMGPIESVRGVGYQLVPGENGNEGNNGSHAGR
jgi:DNA-binding response OmpR family regulator